jgi:hypothetical protein
MPAVGTIYRVQPTTYGQGQVGYNELHAQVTANVGTGATDAQIAAVASAAWAAIYVPWLYSTFSYRGTVVQQISPARMNAVTSIAGQAAGTGTGGALPTQLAGLVSMTSTIPGRKGHGRMYVSFPADNMMVVLTGVLSAAGQTLLTNAQSVLNTPWTAGGGGNTTTLSYGVYSKKLPGFGTLLSTVNSTVFATQRRRGAFGKVNNEPF